MTDRNLEKAAEFAPLIESVHGEHHPELTRVREITEELMAAPTDSRPLFSELRAVTNNYAIPNDVCETFEAVYRALSRADAASSAAVS
ncbi:hypothetical protein AADG42_14685 [Ammonicoccus fulvus]|uniref:Iron-sulfur cluster repair di-iron protein, ric n=1 Tax=Ammonicoccus fulvus TaxID=3138240 RepID=A0ABZ3FUT4_9ACTN